MNVAATFLCRNYEVYASPENEYNMGKPVKFSLGWGKRQVDFKPGNLHQTYHSKSFSLGGAVDFDGANDFFQLFPRLKLYMNTSLDLYTGGLGTHFSQTGKIDQQQELILSFGGSLGWGHSRPFRIDMMNQYTPNAVTDNNSFAIIYQSNVIFHKTGLRQINASVAVRIYRFSFAGYNDIKELGLTDGFDRWWSGGGNMAYHDPKGWSLTLGTDVFTGERMKDLAGNDQTFNSNGRLFFTETKTDLSLNNGVIYLRATKSDGYFVEADFSGADAMIAQNVLHDALNIAHYSSNMPDTVMFYLGGEFGGSLLH
ncbi:MAG: hypothetical protein JWP81_3426 [Ferruginibacter sp.]|nr:hypothetical protein [Ferruginibacter sp.]